MKIETLACPHCGAPFPGDFAPNKPIKCTNCGASLIATGLPVDQSLTCPNCRTLNTAERRFCLSCGEPLKADCILCHTANPIGTVHCANCGAHMSYARTKRQQLLDERRRLREERGQLLKEKTARQRTEKLQLLLADLDEPEKHEFAIFQLNQMGVDAVEGLIETLLNDPDPDARYGSAIALGQICGHHDTKVLIKAKAAKALVKALTDPEAPVRYWSVDALAKCQAPAAVEPLAALLKDGHEGVRQRTRLALQQIGGERAEELLTQADNRGLLGWIKGK
jgi:hypothetical protein